MRPYRLKVNVIITVASLISLGVFSIVLLIFTQTKSNDIVEILIHYGFIILPTTGLWWILEKIAWHWKWVQGFRGILNIPPDLRGRWVGDFQREGENDSHSFVIEIRQTLSKVWIFTYSNRSSSKSQIAEIACDDSGNNFTLCFLWEGDGGEIEHRNIPKGIFKGYSLFLLFDHETPRRLSGKYFTNREPQTKGKLELLWDSETLLNKF